MSILTQCETVLLLKHRRAGRVMFAEDGETAITIDDETWRDMGQPDAVTVTLRPGDQLNDEAG